MSNHATEHIPAGAYVVFDSCRADGWRVAGVTIRRGRPLTFWRWEPQR